MVELVLDASVLGAFFLNEEGWEKVAEIIESDTKVYTPSFWKFEVANAIWKNKGIPEEIGKEIVERLWKLRIYGEESIKWVKEAFLISRKYNITFYDSSYIAMAKIMEIPLWTKDTLQAKAAIKAGVSLWGK